MCKYETTDSRTNWSNAVTTSPQNPCTNLSSSPKVTRHQQGKIDRLFGILLLFSPSLLFNQVVYVARNPKDAIVSFFYHHNVFENNQNYSGSVDEFAEYFMKDLGKFDRYDS